MALATAGVVLLDAGRPAAEDPHPERSAGGPALTADDALDLHALLETDDWFDALVSSVSL